MANAEVKILKELSNADGIVGAEQEVRDVLKEHLAPLVDETLFDGLGSIIFKQNGSGQGPKVMICAHMDEVGFMVRSITEGGLIMLMVVGGVKTNVLSFQRLRLTTRNGEKINGIVAGDYTVDAASKMYFDIGATTKKQVIDLGIDVGDMVCFDTKFDEYDVSDVYDGKAMDDRYGCFAMYEIAKRMQDIDHKNDIYYTATYGEEVGLRGAQTAAHLVNPDIVFIIDVACFPDEQIRDNSNNRQIGKGPMLTHFDRTLSPNRELVHFVKDTAKEHNLPLQFDMFNRGGTDGGETHKVHEGKATVVTCLPCRYGHCAHSIVNLNDIDSITELYVKMLSVIDNDFKKRVYQF